MNEWYLNRNFILVIPANAGIHNCQMAANSLDSGLRRNDELIGFTGNFSLSKCHANLSPFSTPLFNYLTPNPAVSFNGNASSSSGVGCWPFSPAIEPRWGLISGPRLCR